MQPDSKVTRSFTDAEVIAHLKDTLTERMEEALAREIGLASQCIREEEPIPYGLWPRELVSMTTWVARFALRLLEPRCRRDAHLHAVVALARQRYAGAHIRDLNTQQIRSCYYDAKIVLDQEWGRMTDHSFAYLNGDTRERILQAAAEQDVTR